MHISEGIQYMKVIYGQLRCQFRILFIENIYREILLPFDIIIQKSWNFV